jgi:hypothetical protein
MSARCQEDIGVLRYDAAKNLQGLRSTAVAFLMKELD